MNQIFYFQLLLIVTFCILTATIFLKTPFNKFLYNKKILLFILLIMLIIVILKSSFISCDNLSAEQKCICKIFYNKKGLIDSSEIINACQNFKK